MADEKKSVTTVQTFAAGIGLLAIGGIVWAAVFGGELISDTARLNGLISLSVAIVVIAITFILVFYLVSGTNSSQDGKAFRIEFLRIVMQVTPMQWVASLIGLFTLGGIIWVIASGDDILQNAEKTRGLITFSVAIVTVAIALILVFYLIFGGRLDSDDKEEIKNRFTFGKDILMVFVGILGTVMGFYYGADKMSKDQLRNVADVVGKRPNAQNPEQTAIDLLLKKDFDGAVTAFDEAFNTTPALPNIGNIAAIRKVLADNKAAFSDADEAGRQALWKKIFQTISRNGLTVGMTDEMKKTVEGYVNPPPTPSPTSTPTPTPGVATS